MANIAPLGIYRAFDDNGEPLAFGKLYTYEAGTSTPKDTYTTAEGDVANTNPVVLDDTGSANVWLGDGGYKFILKDANDVTIFTTDNIGGTGDAAFGSQVNILSTNTSVTSVYANSANICTATLTLSLLPAADAGEGFYISVSALGGVVTVDPDGSETINNAANLTIPDGASAIIITDGVEWYTICSTASINNAQLATNSVSTAKIQDDAVTLAKLDGDVSFADKLIGYDDSGDPANISAGSGIFIDASTIAAAAGAVLQVVSVSKTDTFTSTSTSYTDITGISASITPASNTNKILVIVQIQGDSNANNLFLQLVRGSTAIGIGATAGSRSVASSQISAASAGSVQASAPIIFLDSPATTSSTTYKVQGKLGGAGTFYVNRSQTDTDAAGFGRTASSITLIEIKA